MSDTEQTYSAAGEVGQVRARRTFGQRVWLGLKKAPVSAWFGMIVIAFYLIVSIFAPLIAPYGEAKIFPQPFAPWGGDFLFGTDQLGRDVLTRLIYGARNTVGIAVATTLLSFGIGGGLGRKTMPETLAYSVVGAVHTLWLAARAFDIGVGWVSIIDPEQVRTTLDLPEDWVLVAYLCLGYPEEDHLDPELERYGWQRRVDVADVIVQR